MFLLNNCIFESSIWLIILFSSFEKIFILISNVAFKPTFLPFNILHSIAFKTKAYVKENISISSTDNLAEILNVTANLVDKDNKISYNKVLAKSEIEIKIVYLTEEGKIVSCTNRVPLVGFIDMQDIKEDNIIETNYLVKNILIKPNSIEE